MSRVKEIHKCNAAAFGGDKIGAQRQERLYDSKVLVVGTDAAGQMLLGNIMGLGVDNIFYFDNSKKLTKKDNGFLYGPNKRLGMNKDRAVLEGLNEVNPTAWIRSLHGRFEESFIYDFNPDVVVDCTNDPSSKLNVLRYAMSFSSKTIPMISISSNSYSSAMSVHFPKNKGKVKIIKDNPDLESLLHEEYFGEPQGGSTSGVIAGIAADEIRKLVFTYDENDRSLDNGDKIVYNIFSKKRLGKSDMIKVTLPRYNKNKILVVGAGALGNWTEIYLSHMGFGQVDFLDYDTTEEKNLNRQVELRNRIGENKAKVLSERLKEKSPSTRTSAIEGKLGESVPIERIVDAKYDLILGCVDNRDARIAMDEIATRYKIPYIDGGTSPKEGQVAVYIPDLTKPISRQLDLMNFPSGTGGCIEGANPSVVMSNAIISGVMVGEAAHILNRNTENPMVSGRISYSTYFPKRIFVERR